MEHAYVADRIDQANHTAGTAQVEAVRRLSQCGQVEEGVTGQDVGPVQQPPVQHALLLGGRVQGLPGVHPAARRAEAGQPESWAP